VAGFMVDTDSAPNMMFAGRVRGIVTMCSWPPSFPSAAGCRRSDRNVNLGAGVMVVLKAFFMFFLFARAKAIVRATATISSRMGRGRLFLRCVP